MSAGPTVACLGAGYFSQFHYDAWSRMPGVEVVASCDRQIERAQATGLAAYAELGEMLERERPDLLDIIVPPPAHAESIREAARFGVRAVICQKPFCTSLAEAREMADLADVAGMTLVVHENFRFQPWYRAIRAAIDGGKIGAVLQVTFRLRPGDGQGPRAYLDRQPYFQTMPRFLVHETAVHWIDTFRYLLGPPTEVYADLRKLNPAILGEDAGYIVFGFEGGVRALFDGNRLLDHAAGNPRRTMGEALVEGMAGTMTLDGEGVVRLRRFGAVEDDCLFANPPDRGFGGDCVFALQEHVVQGLAGQCSIENTARDYLAVKIIEEAVYDSARTGRLVSLAGSP